jgi:hypothetical protein
MYTISWKVRPCSVLSSSHCKETSQKVVTRLFLGRRKGVKTEICLNLEEKVYLIET